MHALSYFRIILWFFALGYSTIPLFWLVVHPFAAYWKSRKGKIYPLLGLIWLVIITAVGFATWPFIDLRLYSTPWSLLPAALFLISGFSLYRKLKRSNHMSSDTVIGRPELRPEENEQNLVTTGLHGTIRHPIYVAHLLVLASFAVASGLTIVYILLAFAIVTGAIMVRAEEKELAARFGEPYLEYRSRVPAIIPKI